MQHFGAVLRVGLGSAVFVLFGILLRAPAPLASQDGGFDQANLGGISLSSHYDTCDRIIEFGLTGVEVDNSEVTVSIVITNGLVPQEDLSIFGIVNLAVQGGPLKSGVIGPGMGSQVPFSVNTSIPTGQSRSVTITAEVQVGAIECQESQTVMVTHKERDVELYPPVAEMNVHDDSGTLFIPTPVNQSLTFDGRSSFDMDGFITQWQWDFGDGVTAFGPVVSHAFDTLGTHSVFLTVWDNDGLSDTAEGQIEVGGGDENQSPVPLIRATPIIGKVGDFFTFDGSNSFDPDGSVVDYLWDFDDQTQTRGAVVQHQFEKPGIYQVGLIVTDNEGLGAASLVDIEILPSEDKSEYVLILDIQVHEQLGVGAEVPLKYVEGGVIVEAERGCDGRHLHAGEQGHILIHVGDIEDIQFPPNEIIVGDPFPFGCGYGLVTELVDGGKGENDECRAPVVLDGQVQPVQAVWQDDPVFVDLPGKQISFELDNEGNISGHVAELPMVKDRDTQLFGINRRVRGRRVEAGKGHDTIYMRAIVYGTKFVEVNRVRFTLTEASGSRNLHEQTISQFMPLAPPCNRTGTEVEVRLNAPIPPRPFRFRSEGAYVIDVELIRADNKQTGIKTYVKGEVEEIETPSVLFVPAVLSNDFNPLANTFNREKLVEETEKVIKKTKEMSNQQWPLPTGTGIGALQSRVLDLSKLKERAEPSWLGTLFGGNTSTSGRLNQLIQAEFSRGLDSITKLAGFAERVVAILQPDDYDLIHKKSRGLAWGNKVVYVKAFIDSIEKTVLHELMHTIPEFSWADEEMLQECEKNFHNKEDEIGNGYNLETQDWEGGSMPIMGPGHNLLIWITQCSYWHLVKGLATQLKDPPVILVQGLIGQKDGRFAGSIDSIYQMDSVLDLQGEGTGNWSIVLRNSSGNELGRYRFEPNWTYHADPDPTTLERNVLSFSVRIPDLPETAQIDLVGPNGVIDSKRYSSPPTVSILSPTNDQEATVAGGRVQLSWTGQDPDGDSLVYTVFYSSDGGRRWLPVSFEQKAATIEVPIDLSHSKHHVKVVTSDGTQSAEAIVSFRAKEVDGSSPIQSPSSNSLERTVASHSGNVALIEDEDIQFAIQAWILGQPVPGSGTIDDRMMANLIELWVKGQRIDPVGEGAQAQLSTPFALQSANLQPRGSELVLNILGSGLRDTRLQVFDLGGRTVLDETRHGNQMRFAPLDQAGRRWSNGVYLYLVTVRDNSHRQLQSSLKKIVILN